MSNKVETAPQIGGTSMKTWKRFLALGLVTIITAMMFVGCGSSDISEGVAKNDYPITINGVTLNSQPTGVAVLSQNIADVILTGGFEATLKAKSEDCTQEDLSILPNLTIDDVQEMKNLGVTLVLVDAAPTEQQTAALEAQGIQVLAISPAKSRDDCKRLYREVGSAMVGGNTGYTKGEKACDNVFYTLDDITRLVPSTGTQYTACYLYDLEGHAATGNSLFGCLISYAGFFNSFGYELNNEIDINNLLVANPYYIFCAAGVKEQLEQSEDFKNLDAVKNGRVYEMEPSLMQRQGNTMLDTVTTMLKHVYPELFVTKESKKDTSDSSSQSDASSAADTTSSETPAETSSADTSSAQGTVTKPDAVANAGTLQYGSSGEAVTLMQERLHELGYMFTTVNGTFDDGTMQAVKDFQLLNGFSTSGIATQEVLDAMYNSNATPRT